MMLREKLDVIVLKKMNISTFSEPDLTRWKGVPRQVKVSEKQGYDWPHRKIHRTAGCI